MGDTADDAIDAGIYDQYCCDDEWDEDEHPMVSALGMIVVSQRLMAAMDNFIDRDFFEVHEVH